MKYDKCLLRVSGPILQLLTADLQRGIYIPSKEGVTVYRFLNQYCGIDDEYISGKIKTVLINGGPVDDIFNTTISKNCICALSGAMPGIAGAMMRIGSPYAPMRESITVKPGESRENGEEILVLLKLFNVIIRDIGLKLLRRGLILERRRFLDLFCPVSDEMKGFISEIVINGTVVEPGSFSGMIDSLSENIYLTAENSYENKS